MKPAHPEPDQNVKELGRDTLLDHWSIAVGFFFAKRAAADHLTKYPNLAVPVPYSRTRNAMRILSRHCKILMSQFFLFYG